MIRYFNEEDRIDIYHKWEHSIDEQTGSKKEDVETKYNISSSLIIFTNEIEIPNGGGGEMD